jgi:hypothetical protein
MAKYSDKKYDLTLENPTIKGSQGIKVPTGDTNERPGGPGAPGTTAVEGQIRYNTDLGFLEQYNAAGWAGIDAPPTLTGNTPTSFDGSSGTEITINGSNFKTGSSVVFIDQQQNEFSAVTTFVSSTELTALMPQNFTVAQGPLTIKVNNPSGLSAFLEVALATGNLPNWTTTGGTLATINDYFTGTIATLTAIDPDGQGVTFSYVSGSLPSNTTINSNGTITTTGLSTVSSNTNYTFTARISDPVGNTVDRSFTMTVTPGLDGTTAARAAPSATAIKQLTGETGHGWRYLNINGTGARQYYCDFGYATEGYVLVLANRLNTSNLGNDTNRSFSTTTGNNLILNGTASGSLSQFNMLLGLSLWPQIDGANSSKEIVQYVSSSYVSLQETGSHSKRANWFFTGWQNTYQFAGASFGSSTSDNPGLYNYHTGYNWTTWDSDNDAYGSNCSNQYGNTPNWYGACWDGNPWGGGTSGGYQDGYYWAGSGGDYHTYGTIWIRSTN